ncbi:MAG: folate-binding protein [Cyanobacteria bacterium]|nr:folate-binding protein [Cyanobacteriota bacterium]
MSPSSSNDDQGLPAIWDWQPAVPSRLQRPVGLLRLDGPDTLRFLHGQTSQDLQLARPGQWLGTCCISPTARLRALAEVLVVEGGAWLVISEGDATAVRQAFDRVLFPSDDVRLSALSEGLWIEPLDAPGAHDTATIGSTDSSGTSAAAPSAASLDTAEAAKSWQTLEGGAGWRLGNSVVLPAGTPLPADLAERPPLIAAEAERLRLSQGRPAAPAEINEDCNPFELGLAPRVSLGKGCYVGQETLAKLATYDGVKQQLRRWHAPSAGAGATLAPGTPLRGPGAERAGSITSSLELAPGLGWIGLALVRRACLEAPALWAGDATEATELAMSVAPGFLAPPVGAGGGI